MTNSRANFSVGELRRALTEAGGLLDMAGAATRLGVTKQSFHERYRRQERAGTWFRFPEPVAFRNDWPMWTSQQIDALRSLDAHEKRERSRGRDPIAA